MPNNKSEKDFKLWEEYKNAKESGNEYLAKQKAKELYKQMKGLIYNNTNKFWNQGIPMVAIRSEGRKAFKKALDTYDPKYGTKLSTHVTNYMRQVGNFASKYRDNAKIPQNRSTQIDNYLKTKSDLEVRKGRGPTAEEMADAMNWDVSEVEKIEKELSRKELSLSGLDEAGLTLDTTGDESEIKDTLQMIYWTLDGDEKLVFEYLTGFGGKPKLNSGKEVAKATGFSTAKVSRIRKRLMKKIKKHL
ncbi:MAG: sigma-70 family RNA polymerase sigma factor [Promethearchaeota archaeon]